MSLRRRPRIRVDLKLPGISIGTDDVGALFKRGPDAGPFLIVSRCCGLALDTAFGTNNGSLPILWSPHGFRQQFWYLRPSGHKHQTLIVSQESGLALESTRDATDGASPLLWEPHGEAWQRWALRPSPDGVGYVIESVLNGRVLTASEDAQCEWRPWFADRHGDWTQQWLFVMPHGDGVS